MLLSREKLRLLFLYSELADYFLACIRKLTSTQDVEVHIIHWPVNKEAPFAFDLPLGVFFYDKTQFDRDALKEKIKAIQPDFIYTSGWMDKDYLSVIRGYKKTIPVVIGLDTKWNGSFRQRVAGALGLLTLRSVYTHCWVSGSKQKEYALKLGFSPNKILNGYYTADTDRFVGMGKRVRPLKEKKYPHIFIYVGRYYEFKGIKDLWQAFIEWQSKSENDWELWCLGVGNIEPVKHPKIKHFGFIQPKDMESYLAQSGVFVMPSRFEPWGVVLHEFAAAGFPLICSDEVGAAEAFIKENQNGYIYKVSNMKGLTECLKKVASLSDLELLRMGEKSAQLGLTITPEKWVKTLMTLFDTK